MLDILNTELTRGIDDDWRTSVQRYPEVLDYYYGLVSWTVRPAWVPAGQTPYAPPMHGSPSRPSPGQGPAPRASNGGNGTAMGTVGESEDEGSSVDDVSISSSSSAAASPHYAKPPPPQPPPGAQQPYGAGGMGVGHGQPYEGRPVGPQGAPNMGVPYSGNVHGTGYRPAYNTGRGVNPNPHPYMYGSPTGYHHYTRRPPTYPGNGARGAG